MSTARNTTSVSGIASLAMMMLVVALIATLSIPHQVEAARVMQLNPHNLGAFVDAYADGTLQLRVNPITSDKFYEVTDVITATPLEESGLITDCSSETNCKISHKLYTQGEELQLFATTEYLQVTYSVDGNIKSQGRVDLSVSEPKCRLEFPAAKRLYGLPEHAVDLSLKKGHDYRMYNLDVFHYKIDDGGGIYGTIPFILAHGPTLEQGGTTGVLILNSADGTTKVEEGDVMAASWSAEIGPVNIIFFKGPTPADVQHHHSALTGTGYMPPLFSLGFNQCRWNYRSTEDCLDVDAGFDTHNIPYDVLWLDIEHTNGKKYWEKYWKYWDLCPINRSLLFGFNTGKACMKPLMFPSVTGLMNFFSVSVFIMSVGRSERRGFLRAVRLSGGHVSRSSSWRALEMLCGIPGSLCLGILMPPTLVRVSSWWFVARVLGPLWSRCLLSPVGGFCRTFPTVRTVCGSLVGFISSGLVGPGGYHRQSSPRYSGSEGSSV